MATDRVKRIIELQVYAQQYNRQMAQVVKSTQAVERRMGGIQKSFQNFNRLLAGGGIVYAFRRISSSLVGMIEASDSVTLLESSFGQLLKSGDRGADMLQRVYDIAYKTGAPLESVGKSVQQLTVGLSAMGASNAEIAQIAENFLKLGRIGGKQIEDVNGALYQFSQALASNRLQGDEFRAILERVPLVAQEIAKYLDVDIGKLKDLAKQGIITADVMRNAMLQSSDDIDKAFKALPAIWEQGVARVKTAMTELYVAIIQSSGMGTKIGETFTRVAEKIRALAEAAELAVRGFKIIGESIKEAFTVLTTGNNLVAILGAVAIAIGKSDAAALALGGRLKNLWRVIRAHPFAILVTALGYVITNMDKIKEIAEDVAAYFGGIAWDDFTRRAEEILELEAQQEEAARKKVRFWSNEENPMWAAREESLRRQVLALREALTADITFNAELYRGQQASKDAAEANAKAAEKWIERVKKLNAILEENRKKVRDQVNSWLDEAEPIRVLQRNLQMLHASLELGDINEEQFAKIVALWTGVAEAEQAAADAARDARKEIDAYINFGAEAYDAWIKDLEQRASALRDRLDPSRVLQREIDGFKELLSQGKIELDEYIAATTKAMKDYEDGLKKTGWAAVIEELRDSTSQFVAQFTNTIVDGLRTGQMAFADFAEEVIASIAKIMLNKFVMNFLESFANSGGGGSWFQQIFGTQSAMTATASVEPMSGMARFDALGQPRMNVGVLQAPTHQYDASSGKTTPVTVNVHNHANVGVEVEERRNSNGGVDLEILIEQKVNQAIAGGGTDRAMRSAYGIGRIGY